VAVQLPEPGLAWHRVGIIAGSLSILAILGALWVRLRATNAGHERRIRCLLNDAIVLMVINGILFAGFLFGTVLLVFSLPETVTSIPIQFLHTTALALFLLGLGFVIGLPNYVAYRYNPDVLGRIHDRANRFASERSPS
jgi:uncharacterized membrane protein